MSTELYAYAVEMKKYLEAQAVRIAALESEFHALKREAKERTNHPPMNIEKIEYKFDQLKIERLEGTLNIGVNPANVKELDDVIVNGNPYSTSFSQPMRDDLKEHISSHIAGYIDTELNSIISNTEKETGKKFNDQVDGFIKDDLLRQLPERIEYYLQKFPFNEHHERNEEYAERLIEHIKTDVEQAVRVFLLNSYPVQNGG